MVEHEFHAMNTRWWMRAEGGTPALMREAEHLAHDAEERFSRFREGSLLSRLNREREARDPLLAEVMRLALRLRDATGGAFDPAVGGAVVAAGYDRSFERLRAGPAASRGNEAAAALLPAAPSGPRIAVEGDRVALAGTGRVDLGGIVKGWTVDRIAAALGDAGVESLVVDGGGDIRAAGHGPGGDADGDADGHGWPVGVAGGRAVALRDAAVCTSSTLHRRWRRGGGEAHHIIAPESGQPSCSGVTEAAVVAREAAVADALATALVADPGRALPALAVLGAEALLRDEGGTWRMTPGMEAYLQ